MTDNKKDTDNKKQSNTNSDLTQKISRFTKGLIYGDSNRSWISSDDHKRIQKEIDKTNNIFKEVEKTEPTKEALDQARKASGTGQLLDKAGEMCKYGDKMWNYAVHPEEFEEKYRKAQENYSAADHHNKKRVTSRNTDEYLTQWRSDRKALTELIKQFKKTPEEVQIQVEKELSGLVGRANKILEKLDNNSNELKLDGQTKTVFDEKVNVVKKCVNTYSSEEFGEEITEGKDLKRLYAELKYGTRILSEIIDKFDIKRSGSDFLAQDNKQRKSFGEILERNGNILKHKTGIDLDNFPPIIELRKLCTKVDDILFRDPKTLEALKKIFDERYTTDPEDVGDCYVEITTWTKEWPTKAGEKKPCYENEIDFSKGIFMFFSNDNTMDKKIHDKDTEPMHLSDVHGQQCIKSIEDGIAEKIGITKLSDFNPEELKALGISHPKTVESLQSIVSLNDKKTFYPKDREYYEILSTIPGKSKIYFIERYFPEFEITHIEFKKGNDPRKIESITYHLAKKLEYKDKDKEEKTKTIVSSLSGSKKQQKRFAIDD